MNVVASKDQPNATEDIDGDGSPSRAGGDQGAPAWWHPAATVAKVSSVPKAVEKKLARQPLARMTLAWPRTVRYLVGEVLGEDVPGVPPARLTPSLVGHVVMDESIMALAVGPNRFPRRADYVRVGDELARAHDLFTERGWLDDPISFHQTPPPMEEPVRTKGWALGQSYERIWWPSGYQPHLGVPGTDRWLAFESNRTASAWVLRHRDHSRPWVVAIHGFGCGSTFMDLFSFRASFLHKELGVNVAAIVLPVHGTRRPSRFNGEEFLSFEFMNSVHGLTQALWDVRRLLSWVRAQDPDGLGVFGVSLGGLVASLVAAVDPDLDMVMAGIPVVDFPGLIEHHAPRHLQMRSIEHNILNGTAQDVHRVVSPLAMPVAAPIGARAIFAGRADRLATTEQARKLWEHWDEPETSWFPGNHVGYLWSDVVWKFVASAMDKRGLTA
ncbi:MAG: alpha/beta hydrolase family protein [Microthrixaceae bacterium]|nr:alpha/beta hydrolase family protein [Microthrixaceae bacterium]